MKHRNKIQRLAIRQKEWESLSNKKGTKKPGSLKK